MPLCNDSGQVV